MEGEKKNLKRNFDGAKGAGHHARAEQRGRCDGKGRHVDRQARRHAYLIVTSGKVI